MIGIYLGVTGVLEHYGISALVYPSYIMDPGLGMYFDRTRGPFLNPAVLGCVLSVLFLVGMVYVNNFGNKIGYWVLLIPMVATIYFTYTRSAWLQLAVAPAIIALVEPRMRKPFCFMGIVFILLFVCGVLGKFSMEGGTLFSQRERSVNDRVNIMNAARNMFMEKPLTGFGYGTFGRYAYTERYFTEMAGVPLHGQGEGNHNVLLGLLAEVGLIGTIPYLLIFYYFIKVSVSLVKRSESGPRLERDIGVVNLAIVIGYFVATQFYDPRFFAMLNGLVFAIAGVTFSISEGRPSEQ